MNPHEPLDDKAARPNLPDLFAEVRQRGNEPVPPSAPYTRQARVLASTRSLPVPPSSRRAGERHPDHDAHS